MKNLMIFLTLAFLLVPAAAENKVEYWIQIVKIPPGNPLHGKDYDKNSPPDLCVEVEQDGKCVVAKGGWKIDIDDYEETESKEGWSITLPDKFNNRRKLDFDKKDSKLSFIIWDFDAMDADDLIIRIDDVKLADFYSKDKNPKLLEKVTIVENNPDIPEANKIKIILVKK